MLLLVLAGVAAWLSFQAQAGYVAAHNGGAAGQAQAWAVLLDAATAGVSLLRLNDALTGSGAVGATRLVLAGCIGASVTMNLLHTPSRTAGGFLVAGVPPVLYAVLLELLLVKVTHMLVPARRGAVAFGLRRTAGWLHFPGAMWSAHRRGLRRFLTECAEHDGSDFGAAQGVSVESAQLPSRTAVAPVRHAEGDVASRRGSRSGLGAEAQGSGTSAAAPVVALLPLDVEPFGGGTDGGVRCADPRRVPVRRGRRGVKRAEFEAQLMAQLRAGDRRVLSVDRRARNRAAYEAAAALPAPLSPGTARRYVVDALPRLEAAHQAGADDAARNLRSVT